MADSLDEIDAVDLSFDEPLVFAEPSNPWARVSEIAARVGVAPHEFGGPATITATGADGKQYDVWSVIAAVLDRIEEAGK